MTAVKINVFDGRLRALLFVSGALIPIFFQTYVALIFANYINSHQEIVILFREIGLVIMTFATIYFLIFAKKQKVKDQNRIKVKSKKSRFFMGLVISAINFFPIPYYVLISVALASYQLFEFSPVPIYSFVFGVVLGSFGMLYCYVVFFEKMKSKTDFFVTNMNTIIGSITGIVSLVTMINIIQFYFK